jgi:hypothetical protein
LLLICDQNHVLAASDAFDMAPVTMRCSKNKHPICSIFRSFAGKEFARNGSFPFLRSRSVEAELHAELVPDSFDVRVVPGIHVSLRFRITPVLHENHLSGFRAAYCGA